MTREARVLSKQSFAMLANLSEAAVFFMVGAACTVYFADVHVTLLAATLLGCAGSRAISLAGLSTLLNACTARCGGGTGAAAAPAPPHDAPISGPRGAVVGSERRLGGRQLVALWFGGLRGAVAFALVLSFPSSYRATLVGTTAWSVWACVLSSIAELSCDCGFLCVTGLCSSRH
jgi:NhaP-type Na+/H+ or K+/H+ antiporter